MVVMVVVNGPRTRSATCGVLSLLVWMVPSGTRSVRGRVLRMGSVRVMGRVPQRPGMRVVRVASGVRLSQESRGGGAVHPPGGGRRRGQRVVAAEVGGHRRATGGGSGGGRGEVPQPGGGRGGRGGMVGVVRMVRVGVMWDAVVVAVRGEGRFPAAAVQRRRR